MNVASARARISSMKEGGQANRKATRARGVGGFTRKSMHVSLTNVKSLPYVCTAPMTGGFLRRKGHGCELTGETGSPASRLIHISSLSAALCAVLIWRVVPAIINVWSPCIGKPGQREEEQKERKGRKGRTTRALASCTRSGAAG